MLSHASIIAGASFRTSSSAALRASSFADARTKIAQPTAEIKAKPPNMAALTEMAFACEASETANASQCGWGASFTGAGTQTFDAASTNLVQALNATVEVSVNSPPPSLLHHDRQMAVTANELIRDRARQRIGAPRC